MAIYTEVAVLLPIEKTFSYSIPEPLRDRVQIGSCVTVPFGRRRVQGFVIGLSDSPGSIPVKEIKDIIQVRGEIPAFSQPLLDLYRWAANYYLSPLGEVLRAALPIPPVRPFSASPSPERQPLPSVMDASSPLPEKILEAVGPIQDSLGNKAFAPVLLWTDPEGRLIAYYDILQRAMKEGLSALLLFPRISTCQRIAVEIEKKLGQRPAILHDGLSRSLLWREWTRAATGDARIVLGSRSAVFSPLKEPALIIVDEEQDIIYREEKHPRYNARDIAIMRGNKARATVILGSTIPSVETYFHALNGRYKKAVVPGIGLPPTEIIDMRVNKKTCLSSPMKDAIIAARGRGPFILFVTRKGFATSIFCYDCGFVYRCKQCHLPLVYHAHDKTLRCISCNKALPCAASCPECGGNSLGSSGTGTQRIEQEVKDLVPGTSVIRMDRDAIAAAAACGSGSVGSLAEADVIVGTQMMLDIGLPRAQCVGVVSVDPLLNLPDFRASERTLHLLVQLGKFGERILIQSFLPEHPVFGSLVRNDLESFYLYELGLRKELSYPPFSRLMIIRVQAPDAFKITGAMARKAMTAQGASSVRIMGPAPDLRESVWQLLLKGRTSQALHSSARKALEAGKKSRRNVKIQIDFDP